ncbi:hypothetical protein PTQ19_10395 [Microbacterium esteraromaticum]|uniref:hypothetical protein n=1 Tax=Microbacterium esteraromaticum TaxID=57043 RepID=UPI002367EB75|nr:hypothetical protein [Microbacterium esteraromaticum]WDH77931.1 hypothetical protein PTQ19_10395 [Microbacterium esteraromaticum]
MSFHPAVIEGLARALHTAGLGTYRENGVFTDEERGIVVHSFPEQPPEIIAVSLYLPDGTGLSPTADRRLSSAMVQIKYRLQGHPFEGLQLFDSLHDLIDRKRLDLGGVKVHGQYRSFSPLGQSRTGFEFTSNWQLTGLAPLPYVPAAG